jgi:DNA polymerase-3 subunit alpha
MGKKKKSELDKQFEGFSSGMQANGYSTEAVGKLWEILLPFSDYAFNKAHSAAYGVISYWTAYLKAHYPAEYMAGLLTSVGDSKDKMAVYLNECRRMGIKVLPPDVNESIGFFAAVGEDIRFGLGAVRNVGFNVVDAIRASREAKGRFESFHDFLRKVPIQVANKRTVESLVKAGAFDSMGATRRGMVEIHEAAVESAVKIKRDEEHGNIGFDFDSLFDDPQAGEQVPDRPEWGKKDKLAFERDMLGLYVSDHPLAGLETALAKHASTSIADLMASEHTQDGDTVTVAGLITNVQHRVAKNSGNQYGMIQVEDFGGEITVMFMGKAYIEFSPALIGDSIVVVRGRVSMRDDGMNLHAFNLMTPDFGQDFEAGPITIQMTEGRATTSTVATLGEILERHSGGSEVRLKLIKGSTARVFDVPRPVKVSADLFGELKGLLGPQCLG